MASLGLPIAAWCTAPFGATDSVPSVLLHSKPLPSHGLVLESPPPLQMCCSYVRPRNLLCEALAALSNKVSLSEAVHVT